MKRIRALEWKTSYFLSCSCCICEGSDPNWLGLEVHDRGSAPHWYPIVGCWVKGPSGKMYVLGDEHISLDVRHLVEYPWADHCVKKYASSVHYKKKLWSRLEAYITWRSQHERGEPTVCFDPSKHVQVPTLPLSRPTIVRKVTHDTLQSGDDCLHARWNYNSHGGKEANSTKTRLQSGGSFGPRKATPPRSTMFSAHDIPLHCPCHYR